jgi:uncharacterized protein YrrD
MRNGKNLVGLPVISEIDGADLGRVKDLVFDHDANQAIALLMSERELFGLIDAEVIAWTEISSIGPDAITVLTSTSRAKASNVPSVRSVMHRNTALSGTRVFTTDGRELGALADTFIEEASGRILGYELSSGFVSDTMSGKRFVPAEYDLSVGRDVALLPPAAAAELQTQAGNDKSTSPGGQGISQSIFQAYDAAKEKLTETFDSISTASVEKQKAWVVGKVAGRDVYLPPEASSGAMESTFAPNAETASDSALPDTAVVSVDNEMQIPAAESPSFATDEIGDAGISEPTVGESGEVILSELLVAKGEIITQAHADLAANAGVLSQLLASAASGAAGQRLSGFVDEGQARLATAAIGKPAAHEVIAPDGSVLVAQGQIVTPEILEEARLVDRDKDVIAAAGIGAFSSNTQNAGSQISHRATNFWETAKQKVEEWTQAAQNKKTEIDADALQNRINHALGRPVTRVILDQQDNVILNTGDIITHTAVERARAEGALDMLLDSVYDATPDITPDMMRAAGSGEAALPNQASQVESTPAADSERDQRPTVV